MSAARRRLAAEALGTGLLVATVVGSGIMAAKLASGNIALALLANAIATGAILVVLITILGPVSGAHFNPVVSLVFWLRKDLSDGEALGFIIAQIAGGVAGTLAAHLMFDVATLQLSSTLRTGGAQWFSEVIAAFGLLLTILGCVRYKPDFVASAVGLYITSAYWFTASTSFANPAVTIARGFTDTFAGIRPLDVPIFIVAQIVGAVLALAVAKALFTTDADAGAG
ncbi:MAG: MIP/aquaporin family protein [Pseudomonadota bacterium]